MSSKSTPSKFGGTVGFLARKRADSGVGIADCGWTEMEVAMGVEYWWVEVEVGVVGVCREEGGLVGGWWKVVGS